MAIKQLSVYVENKPCVLMKAVKLIAQADTNLRALSVADTKDFGILRIIVSDTEKIKQILSESYLTTVTDVLAVKLKDEAGSLSSVLEALGEANINIEYMYAFTASGDLGAYVVFRVDDNAAAEKALLSKGINTLCQEDMAMI